MRISIDKADFKRNITVEPTWYMAEVIKIEDQINKKGDATNAVVDMEIRGGTYDGVPLRQYFSEKAPGFAVPFLLALEPELEPGEVEIGDKLVGRRLQVLVGHDEYEGKKRNVPKEYAPETEELD